ncbi:MAG: electron transport complex subunit RsxG [Alphaproteobacteria bacterium]|nr:electron transport complex subunit RsxG [Alphaproteobacteria bacterium]MBF0249373.1 electron transport complex subunit RsxG [Alphaproteobacteria bacterium]
MSGQSPLKLAVILTVFTTVSASFLVVADMATGSHIALRRAEDLKASLSQVIPDRLHDNDLSQNVFAMDGPDGVPAKIYQASMAGEPVAVALPVTGQGYAGAIDIIMGVDVSGTVLGVRVLAHAETPGLGDKIEAGKSDWILAFSQKSFASLVPGQWRVKKDGGVFDQFSGATITPRAVVNAVKRGLEFVHAHHDALFAKGAAHD